MRSTVLALMGVALISVAAGAQQQKKARAGVSHRPSEIAIDGALGFAVPVGQYGNGLDLGFDIMGAFEWRPQQTTPVGFRGEIGWSNFSISGGGGSSSILRILVDALWDVPIESKVQPYFLGGIGLYNVSVSVNGFDAFGNPVSGSNSSFGFGFNLGGGLRYQLGPVAPFFELRYQIPLTAPGNLSTAQYFPFQFGVRYAFPR